MPVRLKRRFVRFQVGDLVKIYGNEQIGIILSKKMQEDGHEKWEILLTSGQKTFAEERWLDLEARLED